MTIIQAEEKQRASAEKEAKAFQTEMEAEGLIEAAAPPPPGKGKKKPLKVDKDRLSMDSVDEYLPKSVPAKCWHDTSASRIRVFLTIDGHRYSHGLTMTNVKELPDILLELVRWAWAFMLEKKLPEPCPYADLLPASGSG